MKRERRQSSRDEWRRITSGAFGPVVRQMPKRKRRPESDAERLERIAGEALDRHLEDEDAFRRVNLEIEE